MQVVVDSLLVHYERIGRGARRKKIVILHGWGDSVDGWRTIAQSLSEHYDVTVLDLPGFGASQAPPRAWGLGNYARFAGTFLAKISVKPDIVIGHSNGGAIAIRGLANGALAAKSLILIDSAGLRDQRRGRNRIVRALTKTGKLLTIGLPYRVRRKLRHSLYSQFGSDMLVAEHLQDTFKRIVGDDVQSSAARLNVPTLLIYGEDDEATPVQYGRILHNLIDGSTLEVIGGAGHFPHLDKPDVVLPLIEEFCAR